MIIQTKKLGKTIGDKKILQSVDLSVAQGETVAILGSNGAGKSTLLKMLALLIQPTSGVLTIGGMNVKEHGEKIKQQIGYLPHHCLLYDHFSPLENLIYYGKLYGVKEVKKTAEEWIEKVGMSFFRHEPVRSFSRGMIQRVAIARALIHTPKILLLDEPHTGLDQQAIALVNEVIQEMKEQGVTTVMVTHDFKQAAEICDRIIIIRKGTVADDFRLEEQNLELVTAKYLEQVANVS
jgi:heme exporter protein A